MNTGRRVVVISPHLLAGWMKEGTEVRVKCIEGLPKDARFLRMSYSEATDQHLLLFESAAWLPTPAGEMLPEIIVAYEGIA